MAVEQLLVPNITGDQSVRAISAAVGALPGVRLVVVSLADKSVRIEHDGSVGLAALIQAINDAGYDQVAVLI
jgi:copper chaperone CopZ